MRHYFFYLNFFYSVIKIVIKIAELIPLLITYYVSFQYDMCVIFT